MGMTDPQSETHTMTSADQAGARPMANPGEKPPIAGRSPQLMTNPSLLIPSLGLACLLAVSQGMRITTLTGIYPIEGSLILRHALAAVALILIVLLLRRGQLPRVLEGKTGYAVLGVLLSAALFARYSALLWPAVPPFVELAGKLIEEPLCCLLIVLWSNRILKEGLVRTSIVVAYGFLAQAAVQLVLSFLQRIPCAVLLSLLPLVSIGLYVTYVRYNSHSMNEADASEDAALGIPGKTVSTLGLAAGVVFFLSFILGGIIFESLDAQNAMADDPLSQLCIIAGNVIGGFILVFAAPQIRNRAYCAIFLMGCFACCAVSLYLTTFLVDEAVGGYLIASSIGLQGTLMFLWYAPFLVRGHSSLVFRHYVELYAVYTCAKILSSACMLLNRTSFDQIFKILIPLSLIGLFCCCALVIIRSFDTVRSAEEYPALPRRKEERRKEEPAATFSSALDAEVPDRSTPDEATPGTATPYAATPGAQGTEHETKHRAIFRESVDAVADEYGLTRQERRVLHLLAKGLNANAIAEEMVVSVNTAKSHMRNTYAKLNVHSQQEIIALVDERKAVIRDEDAH